VIEVVIPAHNAAAFLRETLESIAGQTRPPGLVTVVDDRSTDATREVAAQAARELPVPIRLLTSAGPPGPSAARNTGLRASTAEFVALLDADDLHLPHHHATLAPLLEADPARSLAFGDCSLFETGSGAVLVPSHHAEAGLAPGMGEAELFARLLRSGIFGTSACLLRREAALQAGLFDEAMMYAEDTDLFLRMALLGPMARTGAHVSRKRVHGHNLTRPENRLRFIAAIAGTVARLAARARVGDLPGSPAQHAAIAGRVEGAVNAYLHAASLEGLAAYRAAAGLAREAGRGGLALRPRHLARLVLGPRRAA